MIYLDTSFIAPYYIQEVTSSRVMEALSQVSSGLLAMSDWTKTEFASLLARKVRMGELSLSLSKDIWQAFDQDQKSSIQLFEPKRQDFSDASELLLKYPKSGLRAADALHLAMVQQHECDLYSLDVMMLKVAKSLGLTAMGIE